MKKIICLLSVSLFCWGNTASAQKANLFEWLTGTWIIRTPNGSIIEKWRIANDSTLSGQSFFVKNAKDSILQESVDIAWRDGNWYYIPTVVSQNNSLPVRFKIIHLNRQEFISENPVHDFPQRIAYRRMKDLLLASIEGRKNGKYAKQNFDFERIP